ncbi:SigE family RNA polymerase sigma factor [Luteococcus sp.]|uniref:SigE family RNA polymerase sigma factor n=1 Tax=Luteococcus sp. TaxID=1969402 RepID=UPI0026483482|nr:SigE family RNA polymerase sigma factor [Luteococcus sp.]
MNRDAEFCELAGQIAAGLYRRALLITRNPQLAEDLTQETLTKLYVNFRRVRTQDNPRGYAFTILYRLAIDHSRRRSSGELPSEALPEAGGPVYDTELRLDLARALVQLEPDLRALVVARYIDDLPVKQVASMFGRSEGWVRTTSSRALASLRTSPALTTIP